jgi:hypothetical protein
VTPCLWCDRDCDRCGWPILAGWEHVDQSPSEGAILTVCHLRRVVRPLAETLSGYLHHQHTVAAR